MRLAITIFMACAALAAPAKASNEQIKRGPAPVWAVQSEPLPVPEDAGGIAFVRRRDSLVHLDGTGEAQFLSSRIKLLHPTALEAGNIQIAWNPAAGAPVVHALTVHRDGKAIDVLESTSFEILRREDQLEAARLDGVLTAVLRVPDLRVGDELEFGLTLRGNDPTLGAKNAGVLLLGADPLPGRFRLGLSWEEGQKPELRMTGDMAAVAEPRERAVEFRFDNPASLAPPKDAPPRYGWQRVVEYSDFGAWTDISRHFAPLYRKAAALEAASPLKQEALRIAAAHASPLDRASAALKLVQQEVRYIYVGLDGANLTPATAEETWRRRYGDCKGKTALLLALLAELSIEAAPVLVSNSGADDGLDARLPNPGFFDHVLVRARIAGSDYWLDGTLPPVARPSLTPVLPYRWVLPLTAEGRSIEYVDWRPPHAPDEITLHEIDARAGFDQPARITNITIKRGIQGLQAQAQLSALAPSQLLSSTRQHLVGETWQAIDDVRWHYDVETQASVLTIVGTGTVEWDDEGNGARSFTLPGGGFNPPAKRVRPADQDQNAPFYAAPEFDCHVTTVRLPSQTAAAHWTFNSSYDTQIFGRRYRRAFDLRDGAVRMVRSSRVEQPEISAAIAARDNDRIGAFDNSMGWIHYDPTGRRSGQQSRERVPATYEIDWTADSDPCLRPAKPPAS